MLFYDINGNVIKLKKKAALKNVEKYGIKCSLCGKNVILKWILKNHHELEEYYCYGCRQLGENNPMYGKSNYYFWVKKYGEEIANEKINDKIARNTGKNNPMHGKSVYSVWVEKYGEEIANEKMNRHKKNMSEKMSGKNNPFYGRTISEEHKQKLREINIGRKHTKKTRQKMSKAQKRYKNNNPELYYEQKRYAGQVSSISQHRKYKPSKIEKIVNDFLDKNYSGKYTWSVIMGRFPSYQFDFLLHDERILIEVNGDYWHCNPKIYPNGPKNEIQKLKIEQDKLKKEFAESKGFTIVSIWENDILRGDMNKLNEVLINKNNKG